MSQNQRMPTESEFKEWLANPVTVRLFEVFRKRKDGWKDEWANGAFTAQDQFGTCIANAKAIGICQTYDEFVEIEYEDLLGESDGKSERAEALGPSGLG